MDDAGEPDSEGEGEKAPKIKAEDNPWYLLATLYGEPELGKYEVQAKNRAAWNRYFAANLTDWARKKLIEVTHHPVEEFTPFLVEELQEIETAFAKRRKASPNDLVIPASSSDIDFSNVIFDQDIMFVGYIFSRSVKCKRVIFSRWAIFDEAIFYGETDFYGATFQTAASFSMASFFGGSHFDKASFSGVSFNCTKFSGCASFDEATFTLSPNFVGATFSDMVSFRRAVFSFGSIFSSVTFSGSLASFDGATFPLGASFDGASFYGWARFEGATFSDQACFDGATFKVVTFECATFSGEAAFNGVTFSDTARFGGVTFSGPAHFRKATVPVYLGKDTFGEERRFTSFGGATSFVNAEMKAESSFEGTVFKTEPPKFYGARLHEGTVWPDHEAWPLPNGKDKAKEFIQAYERLKLEMDRLKKHEDELDFFALELQSRRVLLGRWGCGLPIAIYGAFTDFGRSYLRPLVALFYLALIGTLVFLTSDSLSPGQSLGLSFANTLNVFGFRKDFFEPAVITHLPAWLDVISAVQTILGAVLLFLFGLGVRNRFRMK
jgi:uncharacterized protein YjbI with pentapeptide repeats